MIPSIKNSAIWYILAGALAIRIVAVIFSKGYAAVDDHYAVIESAYYWLIGNESFDYFKSGRNIIYPYLHYLLFYLLEYLDINDPQQQMLIVRMLHALLSLLIIYYGYVFTLHSMDNHYAIGSLQTKTQNISSSAKNKSVAILVAILLSFYWYFPYGSVRNLIEFVSIPFLMAGVYYSLFIDQNKNKERYNSASLNEHFYAILCALCFALAFLFRFHTILIPIGIGMVFLIQGRIKSVLIVALYFALFAGLVIGISDWLTYGYPFASIIKYSSYNLQHRNDFLTQPWYHYILFLVAALIPPTSLCLLFGVGYVWRRYLPYLVGIMLFIVFHSLFPNKQERFILPVVPLIIVLGSIGWFELINQYRIKSIWNNIIWGWFWTINFIALVIVTPFYGQKYQVEPLYYLHKYQDLQGVVLENSNGYIKYVPSYYLHKPQIEIHIIDKGNSVENIVAVYKESLEDEDKVSETVSVRRPNYFIFVGEKNLQERLIKIEKSLAISLTKETTIPLSFSERLQERLNPKHHSNKVVNIYKVL